jgi:hypothetical protein
MVRENRLSEMAKRLGMRLVKLRRAFKTGGMPLRYVLKNEHELLYFRTLDEVEHRLVRQRQNDIAHVRARLG